MSLVKCRPLSNPDRGVVLILSRVAVQEGAPKNPRAVSQAVVDALQQTDVLSQNPEIAGPGFVNLRISPKLLEERLMGVLHNVLPFFPFCCLSGSQAHATANE